MWKSTKKETIITHIFTILFFFMSVFFFTQNQKAEHGDSLTRPAFLVSAWCSRPLPLCLVSKSLSHLHGTGGVLANGNGWQLLGRLRYRLAARGALKRLGHASPAGCSWKRGFCGQICLGDITYRSTILYS